MLNSNFLSFSPSTTVDKGSMNIFSNDGSFMNQFKALLEKQKQDKSEEKPSNLDKKEDEDDVKKQVKSDEAKDNNDNERDISRDRVIHDQDQDRRHSDDRGPRYKINL